MIVRDLLFRLGIQVNRQSMRQADQGVQRIGASAQATTKVLGGVTAGLGGMMGYLGGIAAIISAGKWLVGSITSVEQLKTSLISVTGSAEEAEAAFSQLKDFAAKTPYSLEEVTNSFRKLKAFGLDPSERALTAYGNTASAMGKDLDQLIEAVADAATGEFERLKEFGIKSKKRGKDVEFTFKGVTTRVKNDSKAIQEYLMNIGETDFAGAMDRQSKTFGGMMSTLKDGIVQFAVEIGEGGLLDALKELVTLLMGTSKTGMGLGKTIGMILGGSIKAFTRVLKGLMIIGKAVGDVISGLIPRSAVSNISDYKDELIKIGKIALAIITPLMLPILMIEDFIAFMQGRKSIIGDFVDQLKDSDGVFGSIARALLWIKDADIGGMFASAWETAKEYALKFWATIQPIIRFFESVFNIVKAAVVGIAQILIRALQPVIEGIIRFVKGLVEDVKSLFPYLQRAREAAVGVLDVFSRLFDVIRKLFSQLVQTEAFKTAAKFIGELWDGIVETSWAVITGIKDGFMALIKFFLSWSARGLELFTGFANSIIDAIGKIPEFFKTAWQGVLSWLEDMINGAIQIINGVIDVANKLPEVDIAKLGEVALTGGTGGITDSDKAKYGATEPSFSHMTPSQTDLFAIPSKTTVGTLNVNVDGTANMSPDELRKATANGVTDGMSSVWNQAGRSFDSGVR